MRSERVIISTVRGESHGPFEAKVDGHHFYFQDVDIPVTRGDFLTLVSRGRTSRPLSVVVACIRGNVFARFLEVQAVRTAKSPTRRARMANSYPMCGDIELRPGTTVLGGRTSGFYDAPGIVIQVEDTGGDWRKNEDWAFKVVPRPAGTWVEPYWILVDEIHSVCSVPEFIAPLAVPDTVELKQLFLEADTELLAYFARNPGRMDDLSPEQFEKLTAAVFRELGCDVEPLGAWNEPDGGVDIMAVSKSIAGIEHRIAVQCKASRNTISAAPIRELAGVLPKFKAHQGIVATTSRFTSEARIEAEGHLWQIELLDRWGVYEKILAALIPWTRPFHG